MFNRFAGFCAGLCILIAGCGGSHGPTATVEGQVSVDDAPVEEGMISFTAMEGGGGMTAEIRDGRYKAVDVPVGRVLVQFHASKETGKMLTDEAEGSGAKYPETISLIPQKYSAGVEVTITEESRSQDFALTSK